MRSDAYFNLDGLTYSAAMADLGTEGEHFHRTRFRYDDAGRLHQTTDAAGTITRHTFDGRGRVTATAVGVDAAALTTTTLYEYDNGGIGDWNLTRVTAMPGGGSGGGGGGGAAERVTWNWYDWRNRLVGTKAGVQGTSEGGNVNRPLVYLTYDNLSRVTAREQYDGDGIGLPDNNNDGVPDRPAQSNRVTRSTAEYDERGRVFRTRVFSVDPATGAVGAGDALDTNTWYDRRGNVAKTLAPGGLVTKTRYDGACRVAATSLTDGGGDTTWSHAQDVAGDAVPEQSHPYYDADGLVTRVLTKQRFHDEAGTGALVGPNSGPRSRNSNVAFWHDAAGRTVASADYGTNGGASFARPASPPARSDTVLVTDWAYDDAGRVRDTTDPRGIVTRNEYDALGRGTKTIEAFTDGTNRTTAYAYDGVGNVLSMRAELPGGGGGGGVFQETRYVHEARKTRGDALDHNGILTETWYPDSATGEATNPAQRESYTVNALGERTAYTNRNGTTHAYLYDVVGRLGSDRITSFGQGVDQGVDRLTYAYDRAGRPLSFTSRNTGGGTVNSDANIVNRVLREYDGFGNLIAENQSHNGDVTSATPKVQYAYANAAKGSRLTSMTYPDGRVVNYNYAGGTGVGGLDDRIGRLSSMSDASGTLESYAYLGLSTVVERGRGNGVNLTYVGPPTGTGVGGDGGDKYTGLDRFGRVVAHRWTTPDGTASVDRFGYGHDRNGNRLYRENLVNAAFSELYVDPATGAYDALDRLTSFSRGTLNVGKDGLAGSASRSQAWDLDPLGNWNGVTTDGTAQTRQHDTQNRITGIGGTAATPAHSANGEMTLDEQGRVLAYDAWGRLVSAGTSTYEYDALNRRIGHNAARFFHSDKWQVIEERDTAGATTARNVWSPVYVDAMVLRDRDADASAANGLEERVYVLQDANFNVTSIVGKNGTQWEVVERYAYDPYVERTVLNADWTVDTDGLSDFAFVHGHQGGRHDMAMGLVDFRNRFLNTSLGRWNRQDPAGYVDGSSLFLYTLANPSTLTDSSGLQTRLLDESDCLAMLRKRTGELGIRMVKVRVGAAIPSVGGAVSGVVVSGTTYALTKSKTATGVVAGIWGVAMSFCTMSELSASSHEGNFYADSLQEGYDNCLEMVAARRTRVGIDWEP